MTLPERCIDACRRLIGGHVVLCVKLVHAEFIDRDKQCGIERLDLYIGCQKHSHVVTRIYLGMISSACTKLQAL